jgi:hypothetical protein
MFCHRAFLLLGVTLTLSAQESADRAIESPKPAPESQDKRLFGIVPNFKTSPTLADYKPLSTREKYKLASEDAFDRGTFILAAAFAGKSQLSNANPSFGQGVKGYAHYFVTSYADWAVGDYMTEAVFPSLFHQDPRYFRKGTGGALSRLGSAVGQIFWTHTDSGGSTFNVSEIGGNSALVALSQAYYPEDRKPSSAASKLAVQVAVDMSSNIMKEFYPEIRRLFHRKHSGSPPSVTSGSGPEAQGSVHR